MKMMKKFMAMSLAFAMVFGIAYFAKPTSFTGNANNETPAIPVTQDLQIRTYTNETKTHVDKEIPIYSIIQDNGFGANYVKLRDIAYYVNFDVVWDATAPNEMRIYTNRHYLDPWKESGPATEEKTAVKSTMDIYIDDMKVDVDAYMIDNNNYFKIRDLAKAVGFSCVYNAKYNMVIVDAKYPYQDGDKPFTKENYPVERVINYQATEWYDSSAGELMDEPNIDEALSSKNPTLRMNYMELYATEEDKRGISGGSSGDLAIAINLAAQALADEEKIATNCTEEVTLVARNGVKRTYMMNPYYRYPAARSNLCLVFPYDDTSLTYRLREENFGDNGIIGTIIPSSITNTMEDPFGSGNSHESLTGIREDTAHILAKLDDFSSDREKIRYLGQQVCARMDYAQKGMTLPDGIAALNDGSFWAGWPTDDVACGVCEHYVRAFERICVAAGYDYIRLGNGTHSWDVVYLCDENKWVVVDCTWADGYDYNNRPDLKEECESKYLCGDLNTYENTGPNPFYGAYTEKLIIELADIIKDKGL